MTTAIVRPDDPMRELATPKSTDDIYGIAKQMFSAGLVPSTFKSIDSAFLAMMKGAEYGLLPQQSLAGFYVINNIAHPFGTCLCGIVKGSRPFEDEIEGCVEGLAEMRHMSTEENPYKPGSVRGDMFAELQRMLKRRLARIDERKDSKALPLYFCGWSVLKRRNTEPTGVLFDSFDSQRGGMSGGNWAKFPQRMHMHRAATFNRRDGFADVLMGLDMTYEEAVDLGRTIDLGTQSAPSPAVASPRATLDTLGTVVRVDEGPLASQPAAAPPAPRSAPAASAPPAPAAPPSMPASAAALRQIYQGVGNAAPASDVPLDGEEGGEKPAQPQGPSQKPGARALAEAAAAARSAGFDPSQVGREVVERLFGEGVTTKDLSDNEHLQIAREMQVRIQQPAEPSPPNDGTDF